MKGIGDINDYDIVVSPSPQPSPIKGEEVFFDPFGGAKPRL
jgi:hypothetical protein